MSETKIKILIKLENDDCRTKLEAGYGIKMNAFSFYLKNIESFLDASKKFKFAKVRKRMRNASQEDLKISLLPRC